MKLAMVALLLGGTFQIAMPAAAQDRAENVREAHLAVLDQCPITPGRAAEQEWKTSTPEIAPFLAMFLAGAAGELVKQGLTAGGEALEEASKERGYVAEGVTGFLSVRISKKDTEHRTARATPQSRCLILFMEGKEPLANLETDSVLKTKLDAASAGGAPSDLYDGNNTVVEKLKAIGLRRHPSLYVEARLLPIKEGLVLRPMLVYYRSVLGGAPTKAAAAELHLTLAVPGGTDLGTAFATVRLALPRIAPGTALAWDDLLSSTSVIMPPRPSTGFVADRVTEMNAAYTLVTTRQKELVVARRAVTAAEAVPESKRTPAQKAALQTAKDVRDDAEEDAKITAATTLAFESFDAGATNAKMRFVVIKDESKFGLALAKALKGQAEAAGKAATTALTPQPEWTANDTGYARALSAVTAKQREYDTAVAEGRSADIVKLGDELFILKASLNEAAVAASKPIPYPSLL